MKVYLCYKFKDEDLKQLKTRLIAFNKLIEESTNWETFIFFRDVQKWKTGMLLNEVIFKAQEGIKNCDALLIEASEKANGIYFEIGYARALGKKIILLHQKDAEANFLDSCADIIVKYETNEDLKTKLKELSERFN